MSVSEVTLYTIICDGCGIDALEDGEFCAMTTVDSVWDSIVDDDWCQTDDGKHYCRECSEWDDVACERVPRGSVASSTGEGREDG